MTRSISRSPTTAPRSGPTRGTGSPEAARLLRPGGRLLFLTTSALAHLCTPETDEVPIDESARAPALRAVAGRVAGLPGHRVPPVARRLDPRAERERLRARRRCTSCRPGRDAKTHEYYYVIPASGRVAGRARTCGRRICDETRLDRREHRRVDGDERAAHRREREARMGSRRDPLGRLRDPRGAGRRAPGRERASTSSSSAAAPRTSARGSRAAARASPASTRRLRSSRPLAG